MTEESRSDSFFTPPRGRSTDRAALAGQQGSEALRFNALGGTLLRSDITVRLMAGWQEGQWALRTLQHLGKCLPLVETWADGAAADVDAERVRPRALDN